MANNWSFATGDTQTAKVYSKRFEVDAVADSVWNDLTYTLDAEDIHSVTKGEMLQGVVQKLNEFKGGKQKGDTITWYNASALTGGPVLGDAVIAGTSTPIGTYTQNATIDQARKSTRSDGRLSEQRMVQNFRTTARRLLSQWANVFMDETCTIGIVGETAFVNSYTCYTSGAFSSIMGNSLQSTDASHIIYAGTATNNTTAALAPNQITAQLFTKLNITATQYLSIPLKPLKFKGSQSKFAFLADQNLKWQLKYDPDWRAATVSGTPRSDSNRAITGSLGSYEDVELICYNRAFRPVNNVAYGLFLGADALNFLNVYDWEWIEETEDLGFKNVIVVASMFGLTPTYFNGSKRNMLMVPHYIASNT